MVKHVEAIMVALVYSFSSIADGFHITIKESLECKRAGVMEPMTESMKEIHGVIDVYHTFLTQAFKCLGALTWTSSWSHVIFAY